MCACEHFYKCSADLHQSFRDDLDVARQSLGIERKLRLEAEAQRDELLAALKNYVDWHGAAHVNECPADDTCLCSGSAVNDLVNRAINNAERHTVTVLAGPEEMSKPRFQVGDRVQRRADVFDDKSRLMTGTIVQRYSHFSQCFGYYAEMYAVRWDNAELRRGFLPHGLDPIPVTVLAGPEK